MTLLGEKYCVTFLIEFDIPMKLVRLPKMCLNETTVKSNICLMHFLFRMVYFLLLFNSGLGRPRTS